MPDVKWYSSSTSTGVAVASGSGTTNRLMKFDASDNAADSVWTDDGTLLTTTTATGLGLGTATPKVLASGFTITGTALMVDGGTGQAHLNVEGNEGAYLNLIDSNGAVNAKWFSIDLTDSVATFRRYSDGVSPGNTSYMSFNLGTDVVTFGSASVAGLTLTSGTGEITCTAGQSFNIGNAATAPASNYLVIGGVSGAGGHPVETNVTAGSGVVVYTQETHDGVATKLVFAYNLGGSMRYITVPLDGATATWTHSATRP